jgi:hypothetical protein
VDVLRERSPLALIHPTSWKGYSAKLNFRFTAF